ncbi:MAG: 3'-5' exonuclease [Planctomycetota bacterium]|nr:MAG: 3'-5' exonuclease [Planctomycetota bacterium]
MENESLPDERLVFVDLETGGIETWRPILQIAAISVASDGSELESFESKLRFDENVADPRSLRKNQYSRERWLREARSACVVAEAFAQFLMRHATIDQPTFQGQLFQVSQLVAHNAAFDGGFLRAWFNRMHLFLPASPRVFCTIQRAMWMFHEDKALTPPPDYKLGTLCRYFGIPLPAHEAHDALIDVRATVALYREMNEANRRRFRVNVANNCG